MRHPKKGRRYETLPRLLQEVLLSSVWSVLLTLHLKEYYLFAPLWVGIFLLLRLGERFLERLLPKDGWIALTLSGVFVFLVLLAEVAAILDPLRLYPYGEAYYLLLLGSGAGVIAKTFLRRGSIYPFLGIGTLTLLLADPDPFTALGFLLGNMVAADLYGRRRDTVSEIAAVAVGNAVFAAVLTGRWLQVDPSNIWALAVIYPLSVVSVVFLVFGLQKLLDLLPFMYSDEKLEKLANLSNPLIEEMMLRAPGTYHHSVMVSLLSETLARKLGADPLLTRVGAMFHDIGKLVNPQYFIENVNGENPHNRLKPEVSASIIRSHVDEGIALARKYKLPEEVVSFIPEHQGTKLIKYFYYKALEENPNLEEDRFRYPGPIPQSRETAIVMIADTVEAMVRALKNPTPEDIKNTVSRAIKMLLEEGQLEGVHLTGEELKKIENLLVELLLSYYHERIRYPEKPRRVGKV